MEQKVSLGEIIRRNYTNNGVARVVFAGYETAQNFCRSRKAVARAIISTRESVRQIATRPYTFKRSRKTARAHNTIIIVRYNLSVLSNERCKNVAGALVRAYFHLIFA